MLSRYRHLSISQQIILAAVAFLLCIFAVVTYVSNRLNEQTAIAETEGELREQALPERDDPVFIGDVVVPDRIREIFLIAVLIHEKTGMKAFHVGHALNRLCPFPGAA